MQKTIRPEYQGISIRLPKDQYEMLKRLSKKRGRPMSKYIGRLIRLEYIKHLRSLRSEITKSRESSEGTEGA
jgi:predicted DNA-binding protein